LFAMDENRRKALKTLLGVGAISSLVGASILTTNLLTQRHVEVVEQIINKTIVQQPINQTQMTQQLQQYNTYTTNYWDADAVVYTENGNYYAVSHDGTTICTGSPTACLQEAVNYVAQFGSGSILIKRGIYYPKASTYVTLPSGSKEPVSVVIPDGINIVIDAEPGAVIKYTDYFHLFTLNYPPRSASPTWTSEITIRRLSIDRSGANNGTRIFSMNYAKSVVIEDVNITGSQDVAVEGVNNIVAVVKNNYVSNVKYFWIFGYLVHMYNNYVVNSSTVGIGGAGLTPNFQIPSGYSAGGITIIDNNTCIDCASIDEAVAVDYGTGNPLVPDSIGIITNNLIKSVNVTTKNAVVGVNVGKLIIENNRIVGNIGNAMPINNPVTAMIRNNIIEMTGMPVSANNQAYVLTWSNPTYVEFSDNYVDVTTGSSVNYPVFLGSGTVNAIVMRNNIINANYQYTSGVGKIISTGISSGAVTRFVFEGNIVNANIASGGWFGQLITISENPTFYVRVRNNRVSINNANYPGALITITMNNSYTGADVPFVDVSNNYVYNGINAGNIVYLNFQGSANLLYLKLRRNLTRNMSNQAYIGSVASGLTPTIVADSELANPLANLPSGVTLNFLHSSRGVATIASGATSVTVNHGLVCTPSRVLITPLGQPSGSLWVSNITSTSFTINISSAPSANLPVAWLAEC